MGGLIADILGGIILDGIVWGTGALILKATNPTGKVDEKAAIVVGLVAWFFIIVAILALGYWQFG